MTTDRGNIVNEAVVRLLERPSVYLAWQRPFVGTKLDPVWRHNDRSTIRRVLDVGCGPGTNSASLKGLTISAWISTRHTLSTRDGTTGAVRGRGRRSDALPGKGTYDFVLVNSLLHHLNDTSASSLLESLRDCVSADGHVHIVELDLPERRGLPRTLALSDRGEYPRSLAAWRALLTKHFREVVFEPFPVPSRGPMLWSMLYFKGSLATSMS